MRFQEAIDVLSDIKTDLLCDTCQAAEVMNHEQMGRKLNALEIAIRMIDKQISKEPIIPWWQDFDGVGRLCPVCEKSYIMRKSERQLLPCVRPSNRLE